MKARLPALVGLAISLALPAAAQQTKCDGPQDACQAVADLGRKYDEAFSKQDIAGLVALYTPDAVFVAEAPIIQGQDAIQKLYAGLAKAGQMGKHSVKADQAHFQGNTGWAVGSWQVNPSSGGAPVHGNWGAVYASEGGTWKIRMLTSNLIQTPPGQPAAGTRVRSD
jgi:uncharacterized protein (TIGR02246 family)